MRVLVTGGLGFIGSHLAERLCAQGHEITIVDDLSSNAVPPQWFERSCEVVCCDIADYSPHNERFDVIYHLASLVGPIRLLGYAGAVARRIEDASRSVLETALRCGAAVLYVSSAEVYGDTNVADEEASVVRVPATSPRGEYAIGKLASESLLKCGMQAAGMRLDIVRPFNIAGPRQQPDGGFVMPRFVRAALCGEPLVVYGDGSQQRSFLHVKDLVNAFVRIADTSEESGVWNLGNPLNSISIGTLAQRIIARTGSHSTIDFVDAGLLYGPAFEDRSMPVPLIEKAVSRLEWCPRVDLDSIIDDVIEDWRARL